MLSNRVVKHSSYKLAKKAEHRISKYTHSVEFDRVIKATKKVTSGSLIDFWSINRMGIIDLKFVFSKDGLLIFFTYHYRISYIWICCVWLILIYCMDASENDQSNRCQLDHERKHIMNQWVNITINYSLSYGYMMLTSSTSK